MQRTTFNLYSMVDFRELHPEEVTREMRPIQSNWQTGRTLLVVVRKK